MDKTYKIIKGISVRIYIFYSWDNLPDSLALFSSSIAIRTLLKCLIKQTSLLAKYFRSKWVIILYRWQRIFSYVPWLLIVKALHYLFLTGMSHVLLGFYIVENPRGRWKWMKYLSFISIWWVIKLLPVCFPSYYLWTIN